MATTILSYIGIMERKMETTIMGYMGILEKKMEITIMGYIGILERKRKPLFRGFGVYTVVVFGLRYAGGGSGGLRKYTHNS